jgi:hypothetical protein
MMDLPAYVVPPPNDPRTSAEDELFVAGEGGVCVPRVGVEHRDDEISRGSCRP